MDDFGPEPTFPDTTPVTSLPSLFTINGCGLQLYGARDHDANTQTYVTTHVATFVWLPLFALGSYRVAKAEAGSLYVVGRTDLSALAKAWNVLLCCALLIVPSSLFLVSHLSSPGYLAGQRIQEGDQLVEAGDFVKAAETYREVAIGDSRSQTAINKIQELLELPAEKLPLKDLAEIMKIAVGLQERGRWPEAEGDLTDRAKKLAEIHANSDPFGSATMLGVLRRLAPDDKDLDQRIRTLLESAVKQSPDNPHAASMLAAYFETENDSARCKELLLPHEKTLGDGDGARILGGILASEGELDRAVALLEPYVQNGLEKRRKAEASYMETRERVAKAVEKRLEAGDVSQDFIRRYNAATEIQQQEMIGKYYADYINVDADVQAAGKELERASILVVPTALSLGVAQLNAAKGSPDPKARRKQLEKAEKTFLAIQSAAGESAQYKIFLGQVNYWLGKHDEGRKLFDEALAGDGRSSGMLVAVSNMLREVGEVTEGRKLAEEAHGVAKNDQEKYQAASQRAMMSTDFGRPHPLAGTRQSRSRRPSSDPGGGQGLPGDRAGRI
ncbi:MAG: hypothetical protein N2C14_02450 [Planctomycetales bacterium]